MSLRTLAILVSVACLPSSVLAQPGPEITIGRRYTIKSAVLGESRAVMIHVPASYDVGNRRYPVLYLTDAEAHFGHTVATVDFLATQGRIPQLIVVAIQNTDRTRDLTPTKGDIKDGERAVPFPQGGGANNFLKFITTELFPYVDANFRTAPYRVFAGHSFGGLFAMHTLLTQPDAFNAVLAVSPTFNFDNEYIVRQAQPFFAGKKHANRSVFIAVGDEPPLQPGFTALRGLMQDSAGSVEGFEWDTREYAADDHGSLVLMAHHDGLRALFGSWMVPRDPKTGFPTGTVRDITAHYERVSRRAGYTIVPPEQVVNLAGYGRLQDRDVAQAMALFELNTRNYPGSANVWDSLADALEAAGRTADAKLSCEKAVLLGDKNKDPLLPAFREHLARINEPKQAPQP